MAPSEFDLIDRYFTRPARRAGLGVGDDCALVGPAAGTEFAMSTDMLVAGTHFFADTDAQRLGHKTLAVNLSDLAAMGATPRFALLAIALPEAREAWVERFCRGFFALADEHAVELVGGDTTRGPLTLCVTIVGEVPNGEAVRRDGATPGDDLWVSGTLGDAALGLGALGGTARLDDEQRAFCIGRLELPTPRVALGVALRGVATSMLDLSDGLAGDLAHLARASRVRARVDVDALPLSAPVLAQPRQEALRAALAGGDDYELCFTASPLQRARIAEIGRSGGVALTRIGVILPPGDGGGVVLVGGDGRALPPMRGYDHFGARA